MGLPQWKRGETENPIGEAAASEGGGGVEAGEVDQGEEAVVDEDKGEGGESEKVPQNSVISKDTPTRGEWS